MDEDWLASLPRRDAAGTGNDTLNLEALLVSAPKGRVRLIVGPLCLEFDVEDVTEITEITLPAEVRLRGAIAVDIRLRPRAPLLAIYDSNAGQVGAHVGRLPFALQTRPGRLVLPPSPAYSAAASDYLRQRGLGPEP